MIAKISPTSQESPVDRAQRIKSMSEAASSSSNRVQVVGEEGGSIVSASAVVPTAPEKITDPDKTRPEDSATHIVDDEKVINAMQRKLEELNETAAIKNQALKFQFDPEDERMIIKVTDKESGEEVAQIPPEEWVKLSQTMEELNGLLFDKQV